MCLGRCLEARAWPSASQTQKARQGVVPQPTMAILAPGLGMDEKGPDTGCPG